MHISLDSALGRQRRLNSVGESVFQIAPDAAAGYSLRSLTGGDPSVVRVRRESDNGERDFRSSEINSGSMVRWVNEQITPPLDLRELTATGRDGPIIEAAAAYSLRNLSDSYAGDVVEVRRNTDGALKDFKASEVTDGTLAAWVNTSFANALPLDTAGAAAAAYSLRNLSSSYTGNVVEVRRSSDGAVRSFTAAEVTHNTLVAWVTEEVTVYTQAVDLNVPAGNGSYVTLPSYNILNTAGKRYRVTFELKHNGSGAGSASSPRLRGTATWNVSNVTKSSNLTQLANRFQVNSSNPEYQTYTVTFTTDAGSGTSPLRFQIYDTARTYTVRNFTTEILGQDGTVSKWYDQSGNDNHAVQGTPASQPKIVEDGYFIHTGIMPDGQLSPPVLQFDGVNDYMDIAGLTTLSNPFTYIQVVTLDSRTSFHPSTDGRLDVLADRVITGNGNSALADTLYAGIDGIVASAVVAATALRSYFFKGDATSQYYRNGISVAQGDVGSNTPSSGIRIAADHDLTGPNYAAIEMQEFIIYNTDQSDKRRAIEENIGSTYGLTLTSSKDGTVSKWYDQSTTSGVPNANHATNSDPAEQPSIVINGALYSNGISIGTNQHLFSPSNINVSLNNISAFVYGAANSGQGVGALTSIVSTGAFATPYRYSSTQGYRYGGEGASSQPNSSAIQLFTLIGSPTIAEGFSNGTSYRTSTVNTSSSTNKDIKIGSYSGNLITGAVHEVIYYNTDQTANRTAIEANIGEVYGIAGIPAYDDSVNGFVETWYDQSGNGNNATQLTASDQPRIVISGNLVMSSNGLPAIRVNAQAESFDLDSNIGLGNFSAFYVVEHNTFGSSVSWLSDNGGADYLRYAQTAYNVNAGGVDNGFIGLDATLATATDYLISAIRGSGTIELSVSGSVQSNTDSNAGTLDVKRLFQRGGNTSQTLNGFAQELILYPTDQTANRPAIEANINNQYDIY